MKTYLVIAISAIILFMFMMLMADLRNKGFKYSTQSYTLTLGSNVYDLSNPKQRWSLPSELKEISGISLLNDHVIACVQDENGTVYLFDLNDESVVHKISFGKKGDYEDLAIVRESIYVLKSNGSLYHFSLSFTGEIDTKKLDTPLSTKNDAEGLAYDSQTNQLLIACKNLPFIDDKTNDGRAIYSFNTDAKKISDTPFIIIEKEKYNKALELYGLDKKSHKPFHPSGVTIHPTTGRIAVICSVGNILIILDREGNIEKLVPLNATLFLQPEGICFSSSGELYIASEGKYGKGYILKF